MGCLHSGKQKHQKSKLNNYAKIELGRRAHPNSLLDMMGVDFGAWREGKRREGKRPINDCWVPKNCRKKSAALPFPKPEAFSSADICSQCDPVAHREHRLFDPSPTRSDNRRSRSILLEVAETLKIISRRSCLC